MNSLVFFGATTILCAVVARYATRWWQHAKRMRAYRQELVSYRREKKRKEKEADTAWFYGDDDNEQ